MLSFRYIKSLAQLCGEHRNISKGLVVIVLVFASDQSNTLKQFSTGSVLQLENDEDSQVSEPLMLQGLTAASHSAVSDESLPVHLLTSGCPKLWLCLTDAFLEGHKACWTPCQILSRRLEPLRWDLVKRWLAAALLTGASSGTVMLWEPIQLNTTDLCPTQEARLIGGNVLQFCFPTEPFFTCELWLVSEMLQRPFKSFLFIYLCYHFYELQKQSSRCEQFPWQNVSLLKVVFTGCRARARHSSSLSPTRCFLSVRKPATWNWTCCHWRWPVVLNPGLESVVFICVRYLNQFKVGM